jgi:carbon starvation protein
MHTSELERLSQAIGERLAGRPGGAVSLAVGMSQIFSGLPKLETLISYWYHFAIMFEALFILTTVDSGTRVARFLVQEFLGRYHTKFTQSDWMPGTVISTSLVVMAWAVLVWTGSITLLWPLLGISNQMLACIALATVTTLLVSQGRARYAWVTLVPLVFVAVATELAAFQLVTRQFIPKGNYMLATMAVVIMGCLLFVLAHAGRKCRELLRT